MHNQMVTIEAECKCWMIWTRWSQGNRTADLVLVVQTLSSFTVTGYRLPRPRVPREHCFSAPFVPFAPALSWSRMAEPRQVVTLA
jgi:hypothetical protein